MSYALALRGFSSKIVDLTALTTGAPTTIDTIKTGWKPLFAMVLRTRRTVFNATNLGGGEGEVSIGLATPDDQYAIWLGDDNGANPSNANGELKSGRVAIARNVGTPATDEGEISVSFGTDEVVVTQQTNQATAAKVSLLILGEYQGPIGKSLDVAVHQASQF
jgi:hypothetical protein